jgi:uncharacterized protein YaaN involved in tellurite resistance
MMTDELEHDQTGHDRSVETEALLPAAPVVPAPPTAGVTDGAPGAGGPVAGPLSPADEAKIAAIAGDVDVTDSTAVISYGLPAQSRIATFADSLLGDVRNKDAGAGGAALNDLLKKVRELDIDALSPSGKSRIPIVGRFGNVFNRFATKYQKVAGSIDRIVDALERSRMGLLKDITVLDKMYELNLEYLKQLDVYIAAGEQVVEHLNTERLPELELEARTSPDPMAAQRLADFQQAVTRFERRLHDLRLTRVIAVQTAPQIRLIQGSDHDLVEKIQSSILTTVPLWKNQIVIAISLYRQQKALALQHEVADTTNELLAKNAELLREGQAKVGREVERGVVDVETLRKVNSDLIATLEETIRIQDEGRQKRLQAEGEIVQLQGDLRQKLIELRGQVPQVGPPDEPLLPRGNG